jgi:ABC-type multidrug transport system ATPase subunit
MYLTGRILCHVDTVILLEGGRIVQSGPFQELSPRNVELGMSDDPTETKDEEGHSSTGLTETSRSPESQHNQTNDLARVLTNRVDRRDGNWSVYVYYVRSAGVFSIVAWAVCLLLGAACNGVSSR